MEVVTFDKPLLHISILSRLVKLCFSFSALSWQNTNAIHLFLKQMWLLKLQWTENRVHICSRSQLGVELGFPGCGPGIFQSSQMTSKVLKPLGVSSALPTLSSRNQQRGYQHWGGTRGTPRNLPFTLWFLVIDLLEFKMWLTFFKNSNNKTLSKPSVWLSTWVFINKPYELARGKLSSDLELIEDSHLVTQAKLGDSLGVKSAQRETCCIPTEEKLPCQKMTKTRGSHWENCPNQRPWILSCRLHPCAQAPLGFPFQLDSYWSHHISVWFLSYFLLWDMPSLALGFSVWHLHLVSSCLVIQCLTFLLRSLEKKKYFFDRKFYNAVFLVILFPRLRNACVTYILKYLISREGNTRHCC